MIKYILLSTAGLLLTAGSAIPAAAASVVAAPIVVHATGDVTATFLGSDAAYDSQLGLLGGPSDIFDNKLTPVGTVYDLGSYAAGTVLTFSLHVLNTGDTFLSGLAGANPDGVGHAAVNNLGRGSTVGFEDFFGGGDRDYNDLNFSLTNSGAVPEPATWAMMILGFGFVGAALRTRRSIGNSSVSPALARR